MRVNRAKQVRKWLRFYRIVYGVAPPYMILMDGNFIYMALKVKIDIKDRLKKMLLGEGFVCYVLEAVLDELAALGPAFHPALEWARTCCEVLSNPPLVKNDDDEKQRDTMSAGEAIRTLIGEENKDKYMVATQDQDLRSQLRHVPSVGLLFVSRAVLLMEAPSNTSKAVSAKQEGEKFRLLSEEERLLLATIRKKDKAAASGEKTVGSGEQQQYHHQQQQQQQAAAMNRKIRAKKKPKGPNPLSVKKSDKKEKKKATTTTTPIKNGGAKKEMSGGSCGGRGGGGESGRGSSKKRKRKKRKGAPVIGGGGEEV